MFVRKFSLATKRDLTRSPHLPDPFMISIVVPLLNEQDSLVELVDKIFTAVQHDQLGDFEILFVDDGSTDNSWNIIESLSEVKPFVHGIRFRRNFGKAAALTAGFSAAQGELVITMDADLQDDPNEIRHLIQKLNEGYDVVSGWKQTRHDPWHKRWPSLVFNGILRYFTKLKLHDFNCGLKAYRREVLAEVSLYGEMHRFIPVLAAARGFRVAEIAVQHHPRMHGVSKYGVSRILKGFLDLFTVVFLTRFRYRPQHLLGGMGLVACGIGGLILMVLICAWVLTRWLPNMEYLHLHERAMFYLSIVLFVIGLQMMGVGLLAELVVANSGNRRNPYSIQGSTPSLSAVMKSSSPKIATRIPGEDK
jgi:glycosyltransferase involved in cell wall biosynthesis